MEEKVFSSTNAWTPSVNSVGPRAIKFQLASLFWWKTNQPTWFLEGKRGGRDLRCQFIATQQDSLCSWMPTSPPLEWPNPWLGSLMHPDPLSASFPPVPSLHCCCTRLSGRPDSRAARAWCLTAMNVPLPPAPRLAAAHFKENLNPHQRSQFDELWACLTLDFLHTKISFFSTPSVPVSHILATSWVFWITGFI